MKALNSKNRLSEAPSTAVIPVPSLRPKLSLKPTDQMDSWLDNQGFYRKHIARDASSLFRCVSEQIFLTQVYHLMVRKHCIQFAINQPDIFKKLTSTSVKDYVDRLYNQREWGNILDMEIMSLIYHIDFAMYREIKKPIDKITANGFRSYIVLSLSYEHHYDSVYPKQHIINAAICQSIFYEILYKNVFKLEEVDYAVSKMLHDKTTRYQPDLNTAFFATGFQMRLEMRDSCRNVKDLLDCGITPFPYKVAKSLDPNIYRNVEYDTWNEQRKGLRHGLISWNNRELQVGSRCLINFKEEDNIIKRHGYIQEMSSDKGPVLVFVEELGKKLTVPFESLEVLPSRIDSNDYEETSVDYYPESSLNAEPLKSSNSPYQDKERNGPLLNVKPEVKSYRSPSPVSDSCNVHYVHPSATAIPTTCLACISSQSNQTEINSIRPRPIMMQAGSMEEHGRINYNLPTSEPVNVVHPPPIALQYPPAYSVMAQDTNMQPTVLPTVLPAKPSNAAECVDANSNVRVVFNNSSDAYYKYGLPTYLYYMVAPNVVYPVNTEHTNQNMDLQRSNYVTSYPSTPSPNEVMCMPMANVSNKREPPLYSTQVVYSPSVAKKPLRNTATSVSERRNVEQMCRSEDMYVKETVPITIPARPNIPANVVYPMSYPSFPPPTYYQVYDYYGAYPEMQTYDNVTSVYPSQQLIPITYSDEMYHPNEQVICQTLLPHHSQ